jgi:hypothetical protein
VWTLLVLKQKKKKALRPLSEVEAAICFTAATGALAVVASGTTINKGQTTSYPPTKYVSFSSRKGQSDTSPIQALKVAELLCTYLAKEVT